MSKLVKMHTLVHLRKGDDKFKTCRDAQKRCISICMQRNQIAYTSKVSKVTNQ